MNHIQFGHSARGILFLQIALAIQHRNSTGGIKATRSGTGSPGPEGAGEGGQEDDC